MPYRVDVTDLFSLWLGGKITSFSLETAVLLVKTQQAILNVTIQITHSFV